MYEFYEVSEAAFSVLQTFWQNEDKPHFKTLHACFWKRDFY